MPGLDYWRPQAKTANFGNLRIVVPDNGYTFRHYECYKTLVKKTVPCPKPPTLWDHLMAEE